MEAPMAFYRKGREGADFDAGITAALSAVLSNPSFLFRVEADPKKAPANGVYRVSDLDLASRLSFSSGAASRTTNSSTLPHAAC
jgi:hypothetical protein